MYSSPIHSSVVHPAERDVVGSVQSIVEVMQSYDVRPTAGGILRRRHHVDIVVIRINYQADPDDVAVGCHQVKLLMDVDWCWLWVVQAGHEAGIPRIHNYS